MQDGKDDGFNQIGNLIAGRGERPFAPTEEWRSYLILIPKQVSGRHQTALLLAQISQILAGIWD